MKSRLGKLLLTAMLAFSMLELTGCATASKQNQTVTQKSRGKQLTKSRQSSGKLRDYSLFRKGDVNTRILRRGQKARYGNSLDNY